MNGKGCQRSIMRPSVDFLNCHALICRATGLPLHLKQNFSTTIPTYRTFGWVIIRGVVIAVLKIFSTSTII